MLCLKCLKHRQKNSDRSVAHKTKVNPHVYPPVIVTKEADTSLKTEVDCRTGELLVELGGHKYPIDSEFSEDRGVCVNSEFSEDRGYCDVSQNIVSTANEGLYYQCAPKEITEEVKTFIQIQIPKIKTTDLFNLSSENRTVSYEETECRTECSDGKNSDNMGTNLFPIYEDLSQSSDRCYLNLNNDYVHLCAQEETDDMTKSNSTSQCNQNDYTLQNMFTSCPRNASDHPLYTVEHDDLSRAHGSTPLSSLHERDTTTLHTPSTSLDMSSVTSQGSNPLPHVALDRIFSSSVWSSGVHELQNGQTNADRRIKEKKRCRLWEFIRNLLLDPASNPSLIRWENREEGKFRLVQSRAIAYMWGMKKGNRRMTYEKLSRAMRYYYKRQVFQPVLGKRLVYKFGPRAVGWKTQKGTENQQGDVAFQLEEKAVMLSQMESDQTE